MSVRMGMAPVPVKQSAGVALPSGIDVERATAAVAVFALGLRQLLHTGVTSGYVLALLLLPVWASHLRRYRSATLLMSLGVAAAISGVLLGKYDRLDHVVSSSGRNTSTMLLLGVLGGAGVILWARQVMSDRSVALSYGLGMVVGPLLSHVSSQGNAWKFVWAVPVAVVVLSALERHGSGTFAQIVTLLALGGLSAVFDSRSYFATFVLAALLVLWQARPRFTSGSGHWLWPVTLMGAIAVGVYYLATTLLVSGYLGRAAQARSVAEIDTSGSLILGGRPELAATWALMRYRPAGFGAGVHANPADILAAKTGLAHIGYAPNNGYVDRFMFGGEIELHSDVGDLWARYGPLGVALAVLIGYVVVRGMAEMVTARRAGALIVFLGFWSLWNLLFSPLYASVPTLMLTLGLLLRERVARTPTSSSPMRR